MNPRNRRDRDLVQIAAAVVGSAAAAQAITPEPRHPFVADGSAAWCKQSLSTGGQCAGLPGDEIHQFGPDAMPLSVEQQLNTYADRREPSIYMDPEGVSVVGVNGRRIIVRETPEGLYIGGVLITDPRTAHWLSDVIESWAYDRQHKQLGGR